MNVITKVSILKAIDFPNNGAFNKKKTDAIVELLVNSFMLYLKNPNYQLSSSYFFESVVGIF